MNEIQMFLFKSAVSRYDMHYDTRVKPLFAVSCCIGNSSIRRSLKSFSVSQNHPHRWYLLANSYNHPFQNLSLVSFWNIYYETVNTQIESNNLSRSLQNMWFRKQHIIRTIKRRLNPCSKPVYYDGHESFVFLPYINVVTDDKEKLLQKQKNKTVFIACSKIL